MDRSIKCLFMLLYVIVTVGVANSARAAKILTISTHIPVPLSTIKQDGFLDKVVVEAFRRIDQKIKLINLPALRGVKNLHNGQIDGQFLRTKYTPIKSDNVIIVSQPLFRAQIVAVTRSSNKYNISGWNSLKPLNVVYFRNAQFMAERVVDFKSITHVLKIRSIFEMVEAGRGDVGVMPLTIAKHWLKQKNFSALKIIKPSLETIFTYLFLHKKHADLEAPFSKALVSMIKDGTMHSLCPPCRY